MGSNIISIANFQCKFTALQIYECNREREREREKTGTKTQILIVCSKNSKATLYSLYSFNSIWSFAFRNVHVSQQRSVFFARCAPFCCVCVYYYIHWFSGSIPELFTLLYENWQSIFTHCAFCNVYFFPFIYYLLLDLPTFCWRCNYRSIAFEWMCLCRCFALCKNSILKAI